MAKILILTVGGACEPIITSISNHNPDLIYFICSNDNSENGKGSYQSVIGEGNVCRDKINIIKQLNIPDNKFQIIKLETDAEDDLDKCFYFLKHFINDLCNKNPEDSIITDYTGGTKTMSAAIVLSVVLNENISISLVSGIRKDLIKVINHTETATLINTHSIIVDNQLILYKQLVKNYDYYAGLNIIDKLIQTIKNREIQKKLQKIRTITKIFDCWDKFDHIGAYQLLSLFLKDKNYQSFYMPLKAIINERLLIDNKFKLPDDTKIDSSIIKDYILVEDLLYNAERKAVQGKFDDAVGRIYRACELFAQLHLLKKYNLKTGNIEISNLPDNLKVEYENLKDKTGKIRLGLMESYKLISKLGDEIIGKEFNENEKKFLSSLEIRNASILAHGFTPISENDYKLINQNLVIFIKSFLSKIAVKNKIISKQFPNEII